MEIWDTTVICDTTTTPLQPIVSLAKLALEEILNHTEPKHLEIENGSKAYIIQNFYEISPKFYQNCLNDVLKEFWHFSPKWSQNPLPLAFTIVWNHKHWANAFTCRYLARHWQIHKCLSKQRRADWWGSDPFWWYTFQIFKTKIKLYQVVKR